MGEVGQETVDFAALMGRAAEESYVSLKELVEKSKSTELLSDSEKKIMILKYIVKTQQRMLRLNVLAKWCQQVPLIQYCQQLASTLSSHETCFTQAADSMFFMHEGLQQARAPIYDVPSAIEVLLGGTYQRLPKCVEDVGAQSTLNEDQQGPAALKKLETLVRSKLLEISLPKEFTEIKVYDGVVLLRVDGEFKVLVTLGYRGHLSMWRILHLELLVGERSGSAKLEESRRHALGDDLERRMAASENPFLTLYSILHEICVALIMDTVIRQVQALRQGRWRDAIRFELISDGTIGQGASITSAHGTQDGEVDSAGLRTPGVKVIYWLDLDKSTGTSVAGATPSLRLEPGPDLQIKCFHSTFVIDPLSGKEADFNLNPSCIDVEMLLLRAIDCNRYTRLLEIYKEVEKNGQINRTSGDVQLHFCLDDYHYEKSDSAFELEKHDGKEILLVRAYGSLFFTLGINIRNGRFLLRLSKNSISLKALLECEEALNQGSITAVKAFINLRRNSILHLFACIGRFLGLEVFDDGLMPAKLPKNISHDSNSLIMGFPECGSSYFLLMQLDKEFRPLSKLIEAQVDSSGKAEPFGDTSKVTRVKELDISHMQVCQDEINLSLLDRKMPSILNDRKVNEICENVFPSNSSLEGSMICPNLPESFSSIVDEVFQLEKGLNVQSAPSTSGSGMSSASHFGLGTMNFHSVKPSISSPDWEEAQKSQISVSTSKSSLKSGSTNSLATTSFKNQAVEKLTASKSDQDLLSLKSSHSGGFGSYGMIDEDHLTLSGLPSARLLSPPHDTSPPVPVVKVNANELKSLPAGTVSVGFAISGPNAMVASPISPTLDSAAIEISNQETVPQHDGSTRKRTVSDMITSLPSLRCLELTDASSKRRKIQRVPHAQLHLVESLNSCDHPSKTEGHSFANLIAEANTGIASPSIYVSALLHIVRHCSLCIKHARLISQMEALDIPFVEEVGLESASSNLWFRLPFSRCDTWQYICLRLGRPGSLYWDVKIIDPHYKDLWELKKGCSTTPWGSGVRIANTSGMDSHIHYDPEGVVLSYNSVEADSIKKLVADIQRLSNARTFSIKMRKLLGSTDEKLDESDASVDSKAPDGLKTLTESSEKFSGLIRRAFRIEAVGLMSLWFSFGSGVLARFVVEWESGKEGCRIHVTPDQLWPHTKFLEDFINGGEVASLLDCIRLTAGPLHALAAATRPARAAPVSGIPGIATPYSCTLKQTGNSNTNNTIQASSGPGGSAPTPPGPIGTHNTSALLAAAAAAAAAGRVGPGIVPSSLLPIDVSVVLRGPYFIRIIYRKNFAVDMRCFAGDQVWLQPATPPKVGPPIGGSLPCPQFRPFIMEHVAQELNGMDSNFSGAQQALGMSNLNNLNPSSAPQQPGTAGNRANPNTVVMSRTGNAIAALNRIGNALPGSSTLPVANLLRRSPASGVPAHVRGELNTAIIGLGDDGGYGGGWVPLVALKKVLRGILKYLGVLWLFAQLPDLLKEILGSILKDNEGALLNLDQEQPALRFFVGGYVFAVSVHRVQLLLQVLSVKRFHNSQQQQQNSVAVQEELAQSEIGEICDYFSRRVASEPYDASRVASFITLLTLPISVLREFLKLIAWKKGLTHGQGGGDAALPQKSRIELCLENHMGSNKDGISEKSSVSKSNIHYDRAHNSVDFELTVVLDPAHIPHVNAAGGAAWLPYCVSVRLRYSFGENPNVSYLGMEGSHGGRACWSSVDDWDKCKQRVARTVEANGLSGGDASQGRLRVVADSVQRTLHACLQGLRDAA